jgi:hypothetical protein
MYYIILLLDNGNEDAHPIYYLGDTCSIESVISMQYREYYGDVVAIIDEDK